MDWNYEVPLLEHLDLQDVLATANDGDLDVGHEVQETKKRGDAFVTLILYSNRCRCFILLFYL